MRQSHGTNEPKSIVVGSLWVSSGGKRGDGRVVQVNEVKRATNPATGREDLCIRVGPAPGHAGTKRWLWYERTARFKSRFAPHADPPAPTDILPDRTDAEALRILVKQLQHVVTAIGDLVK